MKRTILLCIAAVTLTGCKWHETDLVVDTWPTLLVIAGNADASDGIYQVRMPVGGPVRYQAVQVTVRGAIAEVDRTFRLVQTNSGSDQLLTNGVAGETWEDVEYTLPANEESFWINIPFLFDEKRMSSSTYNVSVHMTVSTSLGEAISSTKVKFNISPQ